MAVHCYATDPQTVINYLTDLHNTFGMTIWVTEFACEVRYNLSPSSFFAIDRITHFRASLVVLSVTQTRFGTS